MNRHIDGIGYQIIIPLRLLQTTPIQHLCMDSKKMNALREAMKLLTNYTWDSNNVLLSCSNGYYHSCHIESYKQVADTYKIHLWDQRGTVILYQDKLDVELKKFAYQSTYDMKHTVITDKQYREIKHILYKWNREQELQCSHCKAWIKYPGAGTLFAGCYCLHCWQNEGYQKIANTPGIYD